MGIESYLYYIYLSCLIANHTSIASKFITNCSIGLYLCYFFKVKYWLQYEKKSKNEKKIESDGKNYVLFVKI